MNKAVFSGQPSSFSVEKAFEEGFSINQLHSVLSNVVYCLYDIESLLNWAEGRE
jgi:hypothetical protein